MRPCGSLTPRRSSTEGRDGQTARRLAACAHATRAVVPLCSPNPSPSDPGKPVLTPEHPLMGLHPSTALWGFPPSPHEEPTSLWSQPLRQTVNTWAGFSEIHPPSLLPNHLVPAGEEPTELLPDGLDCRPQTCSGAQRPTLCRQTAAHT